MKLRGDITSPRLLVFKGALFVAVGVVSGVVLVVCAGSGVHWAGLAALYAVGAWSWCRAYYFAFYVTERYIGADGSGQPRYAGLGEALRRSWRVLRSGRAS